MTEYRCQTPGRERLLRQQIGPVGTRINGIDYLIVSDGDGVPLHLQQRVLRIRCVFEDHVDTLDGSNVRIEGGVRVTNPVVRWAVAMTQVNAPGGPAVDPLFDTSLDNADRVWLGNLASTTDDPELWLVVLVEGPGDASQYQLVLQAGPASDQPPTGFDRILNAVPLSFKVECPTPFDCREHTECTANVQGSPEIDYLVRDFNSFRNLMFERLALTQRTDTTREPAELRTAIVEVLAYAADHASYQLDAVATEAHLGTARLRTSVRRHARLLDYPMHEGCNARAFVHVRVAEGTLLVRTPSDPPLLATGTQFCTRVQNHAVVVRADATPDVLSHAPVVFEALHPVRTLVDAHGDIGFHTWGDDECCLPRGATKATLDDSQGRLRLVAGDFLLLEEIRDRDTILTADADPARRHVVRTVSVSAPYMDDLLGVQVVDVEWHEHDALPFALFLTRSGLSLAIARANMVLVDHGRSFDTHASGQTLACEAFGNQGQVHVRVPYNDLAWAEPYVGVLVDTGPATTCVIQDPRRTRALIELEGEGEMWLPRATLLSSAPSSREFVVETESDRSVWLRFGDDELGRRPSVGTQFHAAFRTGNGANGNVGAEAIAHVLVATHLVAGVAAAAIRGVRNPTAASGGLDPEPIRDVKLYAPRAFRRQLRAVTESDWAEAAASHPQVQRAVANIRWTGSWHTVFVSIDRIGGKAIDDTFETEMLDYLESYRLSGYDMEIVGPRFVALDIALTVCVESGYFADAVEKQLYREFGTGALEAGRTGFFHPDNFTFGQPVYLSQLISRVMSVPGVRWVDVSPASQPSQNDNRFKRWAWPATGEIAAGAIRIGHSEIARCDNDRNAPDNGQIRFYMDGGA